MQEKGEQKLNLRLPLEKKKDSWKVSQIYWNGNMMDMDSVFMLQAIAFKGKCFWFLWNFWRGVGEPHPSKSYYTNVKLKFLMLNWFVWRCMLVFSFNSQL